MLKQLKGLVDQLHLFTGIHTAEAEIMEDHDNRIGNLEKELELLKKKQDGTHSRLIQNEQAFGEHKRNHTVAALSQPK